MKEKSDKDKEISIRQRMSVGILTDKEISIRQRMSVGILTDHQ